MPVYFNGKPLFWTVSRAHHADVGAPIPSTYLPYAKTIYEEGLHFPCVRVERGYKELRDIIRMARIKVRVPDLWYGDYLAQVGACRTAERRIKELVEKYGPETIAAFVEAWMAYGERRAAAAIRTLPAGTWTYENRHDPLPGVADEGIPVRASVTVDPDEADDHRRCARQYRLHPQRTEPERDLLDCRLPRRCLLQHRPYHPP